nr:biotin transporter BioY [uncultured Sellimonas sp.]
MNHTTTSSASTRYLVLTALMTAIICILAPLSIPIPVSPVPISLTNLVLYIGLFILPWRQLSLSYIVYMLLGLCGLPVFSGFSGGFGTLAGPTGGYLIGFLFLILIGGLFLQNSEGHRGIFFALTGMILGTLVTYLFGTIWLSLQMHLTFMQGLFAGVIPYLPGDALKIILALLLGPQLHRRLTLR